MKKSKEVHLSIRAKVVLPVGLSSPALVLIWYPLLLTLAAEAYAHEAQ